MATIDDLAKAGVVRKMGGNLRAGELPYRRLYAAHGVIDWMKGNLRSTESDGYMVSARTPFEQAVDITHEFVSGESLAGTLEPHIMSPVEEGIWAIRTPDLRLYGWFCQKSTFVWASIGTKASVKGNRDSYNKHVRRCGEFRGSLDLDEPKTIFGDLDDVA